MDQRLEQLLTEAFMRMRAEAMLRLELLVAVTPNDECGG